MRNNRGQIFALSLVLITLFLCGVVILFYDIQQDNVSASLVSPGSVFELRDELEIFEIREKALVEFLVEDVEGEFGSEEYADNVREEFLNGVINNEEMSEFIFDGLVFGGRDYEDEARGLGRDFLDENLYSDFVYEDGKLIFSRKKMGKRVFLRAKGGGDKIKFSTDMVYEFAKDYTVTKKEGG